MEAADTESVRQIQTYTHSGETENGEGGGEEALDRLGQSTDSERPTHRVERWRTGREGAGRP